ncbi:sortase [Candidatus Kaiserbacteria bacterium]|nr:sortase [Candidatus Kaiserbacteria bacterium]
MPSFSYKPEAKKAPKSVFFATSVMLFFLSLSAADSIGFVPYYVDGSSPRELSLSNLPELGEEQLLASSFELPENPDSVVEEGFKPDRISIPSIDLDLPVHNPDTRDVDALDEILKDGPARYVDSALLGEKGNVLIFGHSSHLPVVRNQMYKAFNDVPELQAGDAITLSGGGKQYFYSVVTVRRADANEEQIDISKTGNRLTIVTCDTLTSKSTRWVVEAELIGSY